MSQEHERDLARGGEVMRYDAVGAEHPALEDLARLAAGVTGRPVVMINLMLAQVQATVASVGIEREACPREDSMCSSVLYVEHPVEVRDTRAEPRWAQNPFVNGDQASFRYYYAQQLVSPRGVVIGTLCVFDTEPHALDGHQKHALEQIARWVVDLLELRLRSKELEASVAELTRTRDELQRSNHALGAFATQVAHDLRGPITALTASLELLREEDPPLSEQQGWLVEHATNGVRRMDVLVGDVLRVALPDGELKPTHVDLTGQLRLVQADLVVELQEIEVVAHDLPVVIGDATQLRIVLQNLVSNAARFVQGAYHPLVSLHAGVDADGWWLEVADNGPGVAEADRERVFGLRQQGPVEARGVAAGSQGLGLGLATCRRIIEAHDGTITMGSTSQGGALVRVLVPVTQAGRVAAALDAAVG